MKEKKFKNNELSLFCYQLSLILKSGLPMVEAVEILETEMNDLQMGNSVHEIAENIRQGFSIYEAISKHAGFPKYFTAMVQIAEKTGGLDEELEKLSKYYEDSWRMKQRMRQALTYPIILILMMSVVILFLILRVLPMFHEMLQSVGGEVPASTQTILMIGLSLQRYFYVIAVFSAFIIVSAVFYFQTQRGYMSLSKMKLNLPYISDLYRKMLSARFSKSMAMLMRGGICFDESIPMIVSVMDNPYVEQRLLHANEIILSGGNLSEALENAAVFPPLFLKLLHLGHKTGEMENSMNKIAGIYELEVEKTLSRMTASIEPVLVLILSVVVGIILLTVMIPLVDIISNIG